jgi:hypothetical protein
MSEDEINLTVGQAVAERTRLREELACVDRKLTQATRQFAEVTDLLTSMPHRMEQANEDILLRRLRELPEPAAIQRLVADRRLLGKRLDETERFLRAHGLNLAD